MDWEQMLVDPIKGMWSQFLEYVPNILGALIILIVGWLVARTIQTVVDKALSKARFNTLTERAGINHALSQAQIHRPPSTIMARLFFWVLMILALSMSVNALNLEVASQLLNQLVAYIPNVIAAAFILALGFFFGSLLRSFVATAAGGVKMLNPQMLGQLAQVAVIIFSVAAALEQLQVAKETVQTAIQIIFGSLGLGFAIAFGFGCQDIVKKWVNDALKE